MHEHDVATLDIAELSEAMLDYVSQGFRGPGALRCRDSSSTACAQGHRESCTPLTSARAGCLLEVRQEQVRRDEEVRRGQPERESDSGAGIA